MLYRLELKLPFVEFAVKLLVRGPWNEKDSNIDEQRHPDCYSMCRLFHDNGAVSIGGLRARPSYLGCWLKESGNGEEIKPQMEVNVIDCERWSARSSPLLWPQPLLIFDPHSNSQYILVFDCERRSEPNTTTNTTTTNNNKIATTTNNNKRRWWQRRR